MGKESREKWEASKLPVFPVYFRKLVCYNIPMSKFYDKPSSDLLYQALLQVHTLEECRQFLQDLCTVSELKAMEQRMEVAMLLDQGLIYSEILERTGASSATISRVNRCLHYGADGYRTVIPRLKEENHGKL